MDNCICVFTFYSTHLALEFEKILKEEEYQVKLIPVPRQISSSCGLAGRVSEDDIEVIKDLCSKKEIEFENVYRVFKNKKEPEIIV